MMPRIHSRNPPANGACQGAIADQAFIEIFVPGTNERFAEESPGLLSKSAKR
jgi:hypothetical protein